MTIFSTCEQFYKASLTDLLAKAFKDQIQHVRYNVTTMTASAYNPD